MKFKLPDFSKISKRERMMVMVGGAILILVLADRLVLSPWWDYIQKVKKEIKKTEQEVIQQNKLLRHKETVLEKLNQYQKYIHVGETPEIEMAAFLREIETLGKQSGVNLQEVRPLTSNVTDIYQEYGLEVNYQCGLFECLDFIYQIEKAESLLVIEKAVLGFNEQDKEMLQGHLRIRRVVMQAESHVTL